MLLLASASPARRRLLEQAAIPYRAQVSGVDEEAIQDPEPRRLVQRLAQAKAEALAFGAGSSAVPSGAPPTERSEGHDPVAIQAGEAVRGFSAGPGCTAVLGCDSLLVFDGQVFGKPADAREATERWRRMAGGWAELHTGHCLVAAEGLRLLETVTTRVQFAAVDEATIAAYVASGEPLACAGGFALEGRGGLLVERIEGCVSNVIGLSLPLLRRWLAQLPDAT
ncbi:MAG: nucleoside triphosphate pyrophosphatase [Synechococcaceae cyanobacterium ELA739]|jgi:septum formation protein